MSKIRVILADDHPLIRQGIRFALSVEPDLEVVGEVGDGTEAVSACLRLTPDILVQDISMPGPKLANVVKTVLQQSPKTRVLILSAFDDDTYVRHLMQAGISGYLLKDEGPECVVQAIRAIHEGGTWFSRAITQRFVDWQSPAEPEAPNLTEREQQVLSLIGQGLDNSDIAQKLDLAEQTVRNYASSVYEKIGVSNRAQAAIWTLENSLEEIAE